jgi:FkbM family methyltransferase
MTDARTLSYAQNMEDMHLDAIFAGVNAGFYIDVGGGHPVADNVSFRAYLSGWRGIIVEPQAKLCELYKAIRPRDAAVDALVGRTEGMVDFHVVDKLHGFSTTVAANAESAAGFGAGYSTTQVRQTTLAALCEAHAPAVIDWLKVDVEGAEAEVLAGNDWARFRPRIVLVEAVAPGSMEPTHAAFEPVLTAAGYHFVFFDGLNRFYLAHEADELRRRIPRGFQDWGSVRHLYDHGRARERIDHPDHALASATMGIKPEDLPLVEAAHLFGFLTKNMTAAQLDVPASEAELARFVRLWLGSEPHAVDVEPWRGKPLIAGLKALMDTDAFRGALGRIAARHDGGFPDEG